MPSAVAVARPCLLPPQLWDWRVDDVRFIHTSVAADDVVIGDVWIDGEEKRAGAWRRRASLVKGRLEVAHESLFLHRRSAGRGFGRAWVDESIRRYREHGVNAVTLEAGANQGGYVWAEYGFDFNGVRPGPTGCVPDRMRDFHEMALDERETWMSALGDPCNADTSIEWALSEPLRPSEVANLGKPTDARRDQCWPGKRILMGSVWAGRLEL